MSTGRGPFSITVPATTAPASAIVNTAGCRLVGWSLAAVNAAGQSSEGSVTSPAAAATIAPLLAIPAGEYTVNWLVSLAGTLAAADANNFELTVAGILVAQSVNLAVANDYPQPPVQISIPAGGANVAIKAIGAGTVGAIYSAMFSLSGGPSAEATIFSGGEILGVTSPQQNAADTQIFDESGLYVPTGQVKVTVTNGTITGCVYVTDIDAHERRWK